ncbi:MAG TPA: ABC transporter substrate-binding protein, partial [Anaerolineae bacterium]
EYPALKKYLDGAKPIADKLGVRTFDLAKTAERMTKAGFAKDADGFWVKGGKRINATINGFESIHADIVPVLVEMLRKGGFEAAINFGNDAYQNMADGKPGMYMFGHGASVIDPYATLELYSSKFSAPIGTTAGGNHFSRYKNPTFDKIVDDMRSIAPGDPKITDLFNKAIEIYWTDMIDIPIIQWLHRIPMNQTYWTNWPTQDNPYLNGAYWHWTFPLLALGLKAVQ